MSVIKVWNGDGRWSEAISGLDKVYFIKAAILSAYAPEDRWMSSGYEDCLSDFELTGQTISPDELDGAFYREEEWDLFWDFFQRKIKMNISDIKTFIVPFWVLESLRKVDKSLYGKYEQITTAAKAPVAPPVGYCLFLRFEIVFAGIAS